MVAAVHHSIITALRALEEIKHSTSMTEHVAKLVLNGFELFKVEADWSKKMTVHLNGLTHLIDGIQLIKPLEHFQSGAYARTSWSKTIFDAGGLFLSALDTHAYLKDSGVIDLGKYAVELGSSVPVLGAVASFPVSPLAPWIVIVSFVAFAKESWDQWTKSGNKGDAFNFFYGSGIVAAAVINIISPQSHVALNCAIQLVGLAGSLYGKYNR